MKYDYETMRMECFSDVKSMEDTFNSYINPILTKCIKNTVLTKGELIIMDSYKSLFAIDYLIKNGYLRIISYGIMTQDHIVTYTGKQNEKSNFKKNDAK